MFNLNCLILQLNASVEKRPKLLLYKTKHEFLADIEWQLFFYIPEKSILWASEQSISFQTTLQKPCLGAYMLLIWFISFAQAQALPKSGFLNDYAFLGYQSTAASGFKDFAAKFYWLLTF